MAELAKANKIKVILTRSLPAAEFPWRMEIKDVPQKIQSLNARIEAYAKANKIPFVNYLQPMVVMKIRPWILNIRKDGVHPTRRDMILWKHLKTGYLSSLWKALIIDESVDKNALWTKDFKGVFCRIGRCYMEGMDKKEQRLAPTFC